MLEYLKTIFRLFADSLGWFVKVGKAIIDSIDIGMEFLGGWIPQDLWVIISIMITVVVLTGIFKLVKF